MCLESLPLFFHPWFRSNIIAAVFSLFLMVLPLDLSFTLQSVCNTLPGVKASNFLESAQHYYLFIVRMNLGYITLKLETFEVISDISDLFEAVSYH